MKEIEQARERLRKWRDWKATNFFPEVSHIDKASNVMVCVGSHISSGTSNTVFGYRSAYGTDPYREYNGGFISEADAEIRRQMDLVTVALG